MLGDETQQKQFSAFSLYCEVHTIQSTDLNLNAISQVDSNQVVALHSRAGLQQDFDVGLGVSEIQITRLCGRR